jgi:predicted RNA-binding protein with PIN domain
VAAEAAASKTARASVRGMYGTWRTANPPALLVDGYNILYAWLGEDDAAGRVGQAERERKAVARASLDAGRCELTARLTNYMHCARGRTIIAWDAMGRGRAGGGLSAFEGGAIPGLAGPPAPGPPVVGGAGPSVNPAWSSIPGVTSETAPGGLEVVWCSGTDADAFLTRAAGLLRKKGAPAVLVATSDGEVQDSTLRPSEAISYTPALSFLREVRWALAQSDLAVGIASATSRHRLAPPGLRASVRPAEAGALGALRRRLAEEAAAEWKARLEGGGQGVSVAAAAAAATPARPGGGVPSHERAGREGEQNKPQGSV